MVGAGDYAEILNLVHRYPELIDSGDFAGVGRYFEHAVLAFELDDGSTAEISGAPAVQALYESTTRRFPDDGTPHTRHVVSNQIVEIDEDGTTATCRYYVTVFQRTETLPLQAVWSNRYEDRFERLGERWRLVHRRGWGHLPGDVSEHLLVVPPLAE